MPRLERQDASAARVSANVDADAGLPYHDDPAMMRTANPALSDRVFLDVTRQATSASETMTIAGTVNRTVL